MTDISHNAYVIQMTIAEVAGQWQRPSTMFRPKLYPDGNQWCALYGDNLQEGVAGFGGTPEEAMLDFDRCWYQQDISANANSEGEE